MAASGNALKPNHALLPSRYAPGKMWRYAALLFLVFIWRQTKRTVESIILLSAVGDQQSSGFVLGAFFRFYV